MGNISGSVCRVPAVAVSEFSGSLIDTAFDHDCCGVGFVATTTGVASHGIVGMAVTALARLAHRGATAADGKSSDGVGLMTGIPRELLLAEAGLVLEEDRELGVGVVFLPAGETRVEGLLERCLAAQGLEVLGWRDVPVRPEALGEIALGAMPGIRQVLISERVGVSTHPDEAGMSRTYPDEAGTGPTHPDEAGMNGARGESQEQDEADPLRDMERRLYLARKSFERAHEAGEVTGYVCSLSAQTMVYKAMCSGTLLPEFYPDLQDERFVSTFAVFHQRYATNTAPSWHRAQPARMLAHNGEINTVWGNRARMAARLSTLPAECMPVLTVGGTDSTSLDEAVELVSKNGRSLSEAVRMLLPPAVGTHKHSTFLEYHADCIEPWDGPAAISFADGRVVGAALDRNGLRPCRYAMTAHGLVVAGSEAGLVDLDPEMVVHSGRLGPGQMIVVDLLDGKVFENDELLTWFDHGAPYATLLERGVFEAAAVEASVDAGELLRLQRGFGYTREDVKMVLAPMAADGKDSVWSMGDDTPLAFLARSPRPVYAYFRQRFAQVTNPAIDPLREAVVVSLHTRLGPWSHMLDKHAPLPGVSLPSPYLSLGHVAALRAGGHPHAEELPVAELRCFFEAGETLEAGLRRVCREAVELAGWAKILIVTDRPMMSGESDGMTESAAGAGQEPMSQDRDMGHPDLLPIPMAMARPDGTFDTVASAARLPIPTAMARPDGTSGTVASAARLPIPMAMARPDGTSGTVASAARLPIPMAMATGAVHQALVKAGVRTKVGLAVEAGDCRDIHHAAILIGYGAGAVCPWLALETARAGSGDLGERSMLKSFDAGLAKVMSKMGISVVDSYRGAHLFDILGLHQGVVDMCFPGTPAPLSGIGFAEIERAVRMSWGLEVAELPDYGWVRFRKAEGAEPHAWMPPTVKALQTAFGSTRAGVKPADVGAAFKLYTDDLLAREPAVLRDLLEVKAAGAALSLDEVEGVRSLQKRFVSSAMSLGSLSPEAHTCVTIAMNMLGGRSNTGEGGEDREVYKVEVAELVAVGGGEEESNPRSPAMKPAGWPGAPTAVRSLANNRIKQVASGRFGVTAEYLAHAEEIEIKVAQGAKPGEGGQLPGHKVSGLIARLRHAQPGVSLISPPPHHDIYSIEDLAQLIYDLKRVNPKAAVGVKLVSGCGVGTVAAGVAKAYADFIVIAGNTGGTGAAALSSIKYAGNPWELGLAEAQQVLMANGMRGRVRLRTDGGLATAHDVLIAALLGADEYAFGTAVLVAIGCDMARQCHLNTCPTGIATQRPELRAKFRGKPEHVVGFFDEIGADLQRLLARYGLASLESAIGRTELLEQVRFDGGLDLAPMLKQVAAGARSWVGARNDQPVDELPLDEALLGPALAAIAAGESYAESMGIANKDRAVGARLAGEIALLRAQGEVAVDVGLTFTGVAGQSFGAFAVEGMRLVLEGQANDFVGKGLSGGELVLRAVGLAARESENHVILGNVALYGATGGSLFAAGRAGERFAVRNSGVTAVVEGVGDHGCEYMTGGTAVVLGRAGINFAAGMTGGLAWVYDEDGSFVGETRYHPEFVEAASYVECEDEARAGLRGLIGRHVAACGSGLGERMLGDWAGVCGRFVRLTPRSQV